MTTEIAEVVAFPTPAANTDRPSRRRAPRKTSAPRSRRTAPKTEVVAVAAEPEVEKPENTMKTIDAVFAAAWKAQLLAVVWGGLVPLFTFVVKHWEFRNETGSVAPTVIILAGLVFSAKKVYVFSKMVFGERLAALGFTVLVEGVMTFSNIFALSLLGLAVLVFTNWVAATHNLIKKPARR